jgi:Bacterial pre-peptidase C-terminal domain
MGMRHFLKQLLRRVSRGSKTPRPANRLPVRLMLEQLEDRTVPSAFNLGVLSAGTFLPDESVDSTNTYQFTVSEPTVLDIHAFVHHFAPLNGVADADISLQRASDSEVLASSSNPPGTFTSGGGVVQDIHLSLAADTYVLNVTNLSFTTTESLLPPIPSYSLVIAQDRADGQPVVQNGTVIGFADNVGRELGALTETPGIDSARDFVGSLTDTADLTDVYFFTVPGAGHVILSVSGLEPRFETVALTASLLRDSDHDGVFSLISSSEHLASGELMGPTDSFVFDGNLTAGRYALALTEKSAGGNYNLNILYDVPDNSAGNTPATSRDLGLVGTLPVSALNYLSSQDTTDTFKFSVAGGGPFVFNAKLSGMPNDANFDIDIIQDSNTNGRVDAGEILATGANPIGNEDVFADVTVGGTYFLRVRRINGEGPYTVSITSSNLDHAGNSLGTATNIGDLFGRTQLADFVSSTDSADVYRFTIPNSGTITASFGATALNTDADLQLIQDVNNNGRVDVGEILDSSITRSNAGESISLASAAAGTYFVRVLQVAGSPAYKMALTVDTAGNTPATARSMGLSGDAASTIEFIGPGDTVDFYKLSIASPLQLNAFFSLFGEAFTVTVGQDPNGDRVIDRTEALLTRTIATADDVRQVVNIPGKGVYFVEITSAGTLGTDYGIVFATAPTDNAGETPAAARNVGVLGATRTFTDFVGDGSIDTNARGDAVLGADDVDDYYRFTLGTAGPYVFVGQITGLTGNADIQLIRDDNLNGKVDVDLNEVLATSSNLGMTPDTIVQTLTTPGIYYLRVFRPGSGTTGSANYTLSMTANSTDTAGNTLATAKNKGTLTSTAVTDSGFVGAIDLNDFYSFTVAGPGIVKVARNADVSGIGVEIINASGDVLATTGGAQTFNGPIKFEASLPAAGTYFVRVLTSGINSNYSLSLSFANTVGTFALTPRETTVHAGQHARLGLDWTVPEGSWHTLNDVDLRIRDAFGTVAALIRFHEANNTVSLYDPVTGTFGPALAIGSSGFLENGIVKIFLNTSSVKAAGPTSPTVSLTFDIQFKKPAYGRQFFVEAAASDDLGQAQEFAFAGMIDVLDSQDDRRRKNR